MSAPSLHVELVLGSVDLSFDVPPGVTVLFGPSGAGKSRTLGAIAGLHRPERGRIALGDEVWFDGESRLPIEQRRVAYVFQSLALFPHLSALDNVAYGVKGSKAERIARAEEMLSKMHVRELAHRKPRTFSGGEAQRVALARAFAMKPRVVLLDEPFSALDRAVKTELLREVGEQLARENVPSILVTHQPEDAEILGDRVVFLERGRVERVASMSEHPFGTPVK
ncbi:MAG: ATP-binding cassette domain-containing protein [Labilithrix sp.]